MNIPIGILVTAFGAVLGLQAWMIREIVALKTKVAVLEARLWGRYSKQNPVTETP